MQYKTKKILHKLKKLSKVHIILVILVIVFTVMQVARLLSNGTLLGYQVINKNQENTENPFTSFNAQSRLCQVITAEKVENLLKQEVVRFGMVSDRTKPFFYSTCSYRTTKTPVRTVTINQRELENEEQAKNDFKDLQKKSEGEHIRSIGHEAYYSRASSQLSVRSGKNLYTVKVTKEQNEKQPSAKEVEQRLVQLALGQQ